MRSGPSTATSQSKRVSGAQKRSTGRGFFPAFSYLVTLLVLIFMVSTIMAIVVSGAGHLGSALTSAEVLFSMRMSVVTSTISSTLCMAMAIPAAYAFTRGHMPFKRLSSVIMELTLSLPYILLGFALLLVFSSPFGKALKEAGFKVVFEPAGIVFAQLVVNLPFAIRMVKTAFLDVDPRMCFVAQTLGASEGALVRTILLPVARNQLVSAAVLTWARGMGEFGATLMLVGITRMKTETLPGSIYLNISTGNNETAMATAMIMLLLSAAALSVATLLNRPVSASRLAQTRKQERKRERKKERTQDHKRELTHGAAAAADATPGGAHGSGH